MSQDVYKNVTSTKEQKQGERVETVVQIYESSDAVRGHGPNTETEEDNNNKRNQQTQTGNGSYRLTAVFLVLLCALLLAAITVLWVKFTADRYLTTSYNKLVKERDHYRSLISDFKNASQQGWIPYNSSMYYISTEEKNWSESRQNCKERGADLVIITSTEEEGFIKMLRRGKRTWIGLTNNDTETSWKWVDGTEMSNGYWKTGEPNGPNEHCVITGYTDNLQSWADFPCNRNFFSICERTIFKMNIL